MGRLTLSGRSRGDGPKVTERAQKADFRRKPQIFAESPFILEIPAFGGRRKPQETADFRRKPEIFAENRRKPQIGRRHLRCVTCSSALHSTAICDSTGRPNVGDRYDWTTGVPPDNGNDWRKFRVVPRSYPLRSLVVYFVY